MRKIPTAKMPNEEWKNAVPPEGTKPITSFMGVAILNMLKATGKYTGDYNEEGKYHGRGECYWIDGSKYIGDWENGLRHGIGQMTYNDGSIY